MCVMDRVEGYRERSSPAGGWQRGSGNAGVQWRARVVAAACRQRQLGAAAQIHQWHIRSGKRGGSAATMSAAARRK